MQLQDMMNKKKTKSLHSIQVMTITIL